MSERQARARLFVLPQEAIARAAGIIREGEGNAVAVEAFVSLHRYFQWARTMKRHFGEKLFDPDYKGSLHAMPYARY